MRDCLSAVVLLGVFSAFLSGIALTALNAAHQAEQDRTRLCPAGDTVIDVVNISGPQEVFIVNSRVDRMASPEHCDLIVRNAYGIEYHLHAYQYEDTQ